MSDLPDHEPAPPRPVIDHDGEPAARVEPPPRFDPLPPREATRETIREGARVPPGEPPRVPPQIPPAAASAGPARGATAVRQQPAQRTGTPFAVTLLVTLALAGGIYWTWMHPQPVGGASDPAQAIDAARAGLEQEIGKLDQRVAGLEGQVAAVATLNDRVGKLEQAAGAPPADQGAVADLGKRLDDVSGQLSQVTQQQAEQGKAIEKLDQQASLLSAASPGTGKAVAAARRQMGDLDQKLDQALTQEKASLDGLSGRIEKLEQSKDAETAAKANADAITAIDARLKTLEGDTAAAQAAQSAQANGSAISGLEQRLKTVEGSMAPAQTVQANGAAIAALQAQVKGLEKGESQFAAVKQDASLAVRLEAAQAALASGQPLGVLPGAPPALAQFAKAPPPTEAELKSEFPGVAREALAASRPAEQQHSFFGRALARLEQSVTVRQGDHVIVGDPAAGVLARAQQALDDDDLAGAVNDLGALTGPAAAAAKPWVDKAQALLTARAALATMAHR